MKQINNRKAFYNYNICQIYQAGIVLKSSEVKSIAQGNIDISEGYIDIENNQCFLCNVNISNYLSASWCNHDVSRKRKLLLHKKQILKILSNKKNSRIVLIPLKIYLKNGKFKVAFGQCLSKKKFDKRQDIKNKQQQRQIRRNLKK